MKKTALLLCTALALSPAWAAGKTHEMTVEVVSVDLKANTITIKDDKGGTKTAPVKESAVASLSTVKAGDTVTLTCQDSEKGEHEGVTAIKPAAKTPKT